MVRRRAHYNPLATSAAPRWYVVRSMHGSVLEAHELAPGTNLLRTFLTALLAWHHDGWEIGEFSSATATFFCTRDPERRMVSIDPHDPRDVPLYGGAHLGGCPSCGE
jgi:hypothetical protein